MNAPIMKNYFVIAAMLLCGMCVNAQSVNREGNNFTQVQVVKKSEDKQTQYTYTIKDKVYPIWITKNGRTYIIRTSKNGNEYKQYLAEEVSRQVCSELGVVYKENK